MLSIRFQLTVLSVILLMLTGNGIKAQNADDGLKKYDWYLDCELFAKTEYRQLLREKYPHRITEVSFEEEEIGLNVNQLIYNSRDELVVLEKRKWNWGGLFYFENGNKLSLVEYEFRYRVLIDPKY